MSANLITAPGVYKIAEQRYHADPCAAPSASSSVLKLFLSETPKHVWDAHPRLNPDHESSDGEEKFDRGHACHTLMLNDEHRFAIIDADAYRSNDAKAKRAQAYVEGKVPILKHRWPEVVAMCDAGKAQLAINDRDSQIFEGGVAEQTLVSVEKINGVDVWIRIKLDYMKTDANGKPVIGKTYGDYKSLAASINPDRLHRYTENADWAFQQALYERVIQNVLGDERPDFCFVVQEANKPHRLLTCDLNPGTVDVARRRVQRALEMWAWCTSNNVWPGFPNTRVTLGASPWAEEAFLARELEAQDSKKPTREQFEAMRAWQAPL